MFRKLAVIAASASVLTACSSSGFDERRYASQFTITSQAAVRDCAFLGEIHGDTNLIGPYQYTKIARARRAAYQMVRRMGATHIVWIDYNALDGGSQVRGKAYRCPRGVAEAGRPSDPESRNGGETGIPSGVVVMEDGRGRKYALVASGSGFVITHDGLILTNSHVVRDCTQVRLRDNRRVIVRMQDPRNDLALLKIDDYFRDVAVFRKEPLQTGEDIVVAGFPLQQSLSSNLNVTKGIVSSLAGMGDDITQFQISAPVQPGNSGGPVFDTSGRVVGVVVATATAVRQLVTSGTVPQNVNFAIRASIAQALLATREIEFKSETMGAPLPTKDIAAKAKKITLYLSCWKRME